MRQVWVFLRWTWDTFRHLKAFRDLLDAVGALKYVMSGLSALVGIALAVWSWVLRLPGPVAVLIGLVTLLVCLSICSLAVNIANKWKVTSQAAQVEKPHRPPAWVLVLVTVVLFIGVIGLLVRQTWSAYHKPDSPPDEVSRIEQKLSNVSDPAYRQLVASIIGAFDPKSEIDQGPLLSTPDGRRSVDIAIRSSKDGKKTLTAIDILDLPVGRKASIEAVDAADSKRKDINADAMLLCSNTGFDSEAISKAKRSKIGLISILRQGDKRVNAVVEEQIYLRRVFVGNSNLTFDQDPKAARRTSFSLESLRYHGQSVLNWLLWRAELIMMFNPTLERQITAQFRLKHPESVEADSGEIRLTRMAITFHPHTQWLSQVVQIDAKAGIYDYVRGHVKLAPGANSYTISGIDFDKATPLSYIPEVHELGFGLAPGEYDAAFMNVRGWSLAGSRADMDDLIIPTDLREKEPNLVTQPSQ